MKKFSVIYFSFWYIVAIIGIYVICDATWTMVYRRLLVDFNEMGGKNVTSLCGCLLVVLGVYLIGCCAFSKRLSLCFEIQTGERKFSIVTKEIKTKYCVFSILICLILTICFCKSEIESLFDTKWDYPVTVAHAGGEIEGYRYSNCLEAILENYQKGHRTFEIDFSVTSDNVLAGKHDWDLVIQEGAQARVVPTSEEFLSLPIYGKYTPITIEDICVLLSEYPDMWIVTDTKNTDKESVKNDIQLIVQAASELGLESVLDRVIIQIYNEEMYYTVEEIYSFDNYIFTLYQRWDGKAAEFEEIARFCCKEGIDTITIPECKRQRIYDTAKKYGVKLYMHTINDVKDTQNYIKNGVTGIYTDAIIPDQLRRNE